ncbi:MAG TPA: hypothetical protein VF142_09240 [Longimicrobium sp.]
MRMYICPDASRMPSTSPPRQFSDVGGEVIAWYAFVCQPGQATLPQPTPFTAMHVPLANSPRQLSCGIRLPLP